MLKEDDLESLHGKHPNSIDLNDISEQIITESSDKDDSRRPPETTSERPKKRRKKAPKPDEKTIHSCQFQAYKLNNLFFGSFASLCGSEEAIPTEEERVELDETMDMYLTSTDTKFSPGVILILAYSGYIMKTMQKPIVKQKVSGRFTRFRNWVTAKVRGRKQPVQNAVKPKKD